MWAEPTKDADIDWDAIWKDVEKVEARCPAARRQDAGKRHNDVYDDRSAKMQSDEAERRREEARVKLLIAGPPHADDDEALGSIADYRGAPGSPPPRSPIASDDDERGRTHIDDSCRAHRSPTKQQLSRRADHSTRTDHSDDHYEYDDCRGRNAHKEHRNKERRTEKRWYRKWDQKWVSEEEARQDDFDPNLLVEVEVDVEDDHGRDDYIEHNKNRSRSNGYKDDFRAAYGIKY